jgi:hypothetical protein
MRNHGVMPVRTVAMTITLVLMAYLAASATCPATSGRDAAACDVARPTDITIAACAADAQQTETCADRAMGLVHAIYLTRAASEWRKAGAAGTRRTPRARRWLAHATVLDERVQDDPAAPAALRNQAKRDESSARAALLRTRKHT